MNKVELEEFKKQWDNDVSTAIFFVKRYQNPFEGLDYVYFDGYYLETMPLQIVIHYSNKYKDDVSKIAKESDDILHYN